MIVGIAHAPAAGAADDVTSERLAGATRYGTAAAVSADAAFEGATTAILATGENFPDALAASGLAGSTAATPILLTQSDELSDEALAALDDLAVDAVTVVGGTAAVSDDVVSSLEENGYTVDRVAGADRYETAAAIANEAGSAGEVDGLVSALIATGENFPDALAGGPAAYAGGMPILLVNSDGVPAATAAAIDDLGIEQAIVLGGTAAVSDDTAAELADATGNDVVRLAGENRFGTAAAVGDFEIDSLGFDGPDYILTTGVNFPDALSSGPLGGQLQAPIVLTASLPDESAQFLDDHSDILENQIVVGGTAAVDEDTAAAGEAAAEQTDNDTPGGGDTVTSSLQGPELQSVAISGIDLDDLAIVYTWTFDEDVDDSVDGADFVLHNFDNRYDADGTVYNDGDDIEVDGPSVAVTYNLANYGVADATLAEIAPGAVVDEDGNENPAQSVATGGIGNAASLGLLSVEITDEEEGTAQFTFASPAVPGLTAGTEYQLIDKDGTVYRANDFDALAATAPGQSDTSPDEDEPSTVVEVQFQCTGDDTPYADGECTDAAAGDPVDLSDATIRRAVALTNPATAPGVNERIQAVDVAGGGATDGPDLVSIQVASDNDDLDDDQALFVFDEVIDTVGVGGGDDFDLVYSHCDPGAATVGGLNALITATNAAQTPDYDTQDGEGFDDDIQLGSTCAIPGVTAEGGDGTDVADDFGTRSVLVTFATDLIDNRFLVAGQVSDDGDTQDADGNEVLNDEAQYSTQDDNFEDGAVAGPQLIGAEASTDTNVFGDFSSYTVTLTFDKDLDEDTALAGGINFLMDNGSDVDSEEIDLADCDIDNDNQVVCEIDDEESTIVDASVIEVLADTVTGADAYDIDSDETGVQFTNPGASIDFVGPEAP